MSSQLIINIVVTMAEIALVGMSFSLIYRVSRFFNFAHGIIITLGAYFTYLINKTLGISILFSICISIVFSTALGCLMELTVFRPLKYKGASSLTLLLSSLGIYVVIQNTISVIFGDDIRSFRSGLVKEGINLFGAKITRIQIAIILVFIFIFIVLTLILKKTKYGIFIRAIANDNELAIISGIDCNLFILFAFVIGSSIASITGILIAFDTDMYPTMGMNILLLGIVAVIIGGVGNTLGVFVGALIISLVKHLSIWKISSHWYEAIIFIILIFFLLVRPHGFFGKPAKSEIV